MQLHIHPTRNEAITAHENTLTRWSLATNPATIITQITVDSEIFHYIYDQSGRLHVYGGITRTPDGEYFALEQQQMHTLRLEEFNIIELRSWNDLLPIHTYTIPTETSPRIDALDSSPNGRWLVMGDGDQISLLDWRTGDVISHHAVRGYATSGLAFDPTSTFVAGLSFADGGGCLMLWQLVPAQDFVPRPKIKTWPSHEFYPQDYIYGNMALSIIYDDLDRTGIEWKDRDLADTMCRTRFSPDGHMVVFSLHTWYSGCGIELVAYNVASGKRLWCIRHENEDSGQWIFTPDGHYLLVPVRKDKLLVYDTEQGILRQQIQPTPGKPIQALAFDHNQTLWLAIEDTLIHYPNSLDL